MIARIIVAVLVLAVAALQFNDPDPVYWVVIYAAAAAVIFASALQRNRMFWTAAVVGGVAAGMLMTVAGLVDYLLADDFGSLVGEMLASKPYVEEAREFIGLALTLLAILWSTRKRA